MTVRHASSSSPPCAEAKLIRLSKRMGELDMYSRREADRLIQDGRVLVDGNLIEVGHKVPSDLTADRIEIIDGSHYGSPLASHSSRRKGGNSTTIIRNHSEMAAVVLNKPKGYVSGQAEHGHPPAIRLLTPRNRMWGKEDRGDEENAREDNGSSWDGRHRRQHYDWMGFAPAGRLDLDSTGLLVFTKNGVLAKKLIGAASTVEKEYIADVELAVTPMKRELSIDPAFSLPSFSSNSQRLDLTPILEGGGFLLGDIRPLKACPEAQWIVEGERLKIVLTEGRKHHIRRMCRELLGVHVVGLRRVRIGPIILPSTDCQDDSLPEGCWRPLRQKEMEVLIPNVR